MSRESNVRKITLTSYDEIFQTDEQKEDNQLEKIKEIPIADLYPFENHLGCLGETQKQLSIDTSPFKVLDDASMQEMVESVMLNGILVPGVVRIRKSGGLDRCTASCSTVHPGYEIIAGHRRKRACELAGIETMPVIIRELDDDESVLAMVDSNLQREALLFSERAFAYKMKADAIKRKAGRPSQKNGSQFGVHLNGKKSYEIIGEQSGESKNQVYRYIRLTELVLELLEMVDEKKIGFNTAVELSYLKKEEQEMLLNQIKIEEATPSLSQAQRMKKHSQGSTLTESIIEEIMREVKKETTKVTFTHDKLKKYFSGYVTPKTMEDTIIEALELLFSKYQQEGRTL